MGQKKSETLVTGSTTLTVVVDDDRQVAVSGTFTTISLTGLDGIEEKSITADESFASAMTNMTFTMTSGAGPAAVSYLSLWSN